MSDVKNDILKNICYTELVYGRINKKLGLVYSKPRIESYVRRCIETAPPCDIVKTGKNYYVSNREENIRVTVNSNNYRVITVDRICRT